jgi:hypothetical protein
MLDRQKLLEELGQVSQQLFVRLDHDLQAIKVAWQKVCNDPDLAELIKSKKWSLLLPFWQGILGQSFTVVPQQHPYQVLAVDGSQIYYDKHQGPACYLLNVGGVFFSYGLDISSVAMFCQPSVIVAQEATAVTSPEQVNLAREELELSFAVDKVEKLQSEHEGLVTMFDGTLIFFQAEGQTALKEQFFANFIKQLERLWQLKALHFGYISFSRSKELTNILKLALADFKDTAMNQSLLLQCSDMDVAQLFLAPGQRSIVFESKAAICYLYPKHIKPYFCYLNVGGEIARLEFPAWIAQDQKLVDKICSVALDQAIKGSGYPVSLFEAHEQAVVKAHDKDFFYLMLSKMMYKNSLSYQTSKKSLKKKFVPM